MDNESVNLPSTPSSSAFRESVRKSLRKLRRNKKKRDTKRRKEDESIYEVTTSADKTVPEHDDVYEVIKTNDTEYIDNEDDRVVIEHDTDSKRTSVKKQKSIFENLNGETIWRHSVRIFRNKYYLTGARPDNERNPG